MSAYLAIEGGRYGLRWGRVRTDIQDYEEELAQASKATDLNEQMFHLDRAASLYQGDLLPEEANEPWTILERERLRTLHLTALARLAEVQIRFGLLDQAEETLRSILRREPWREEAYRTLMRLLADLGRRSEAIRMYRECEKLLRDELDVTPSAETRMLFESISSA